MDIVLGYGGYNGRRGGGVRTPVANAPTVRRCDIEIERFSGAEGGAASLFALYDFPPSG